MFRRLVTAALVLAAAVSPALGAAAEGSAGGSTPTQAVVLASGPSTTQSDDETNWG